MSRALTLLAFTVAFATPAYGGAPRATPFLTEEAPLQMLCRSFGFAIKTDFSSGRVSVRSGDHLLVIAPGVARAMIDGKSMPLLSSPRYLDGELVVPAELADAIRRLGDRPEAEVPAGRSPSAPGRKPKVTFVRPEIAAPSMLLVAGGSKGDEKARSGEAATAAGQDAAARIGLIAIDAGHGGVDEGARGANGTIEKDLVLEIALLLAEEAERRGAGVLLTRSEDVYVPLAKRAEMANSAGANMLISIHANGFFRRHVRGVETWIVHPRFERAAGIAARSRALAEEIQAALVETTGERDRGVREGAFMVLRQSAIPAALVEVGFLSNPETEARFRDADYKKGIASAIADAIFQSGLLGTRSRSSD